MPRVKFKNDRYKKARGIFSRMLEISCAGCGNQILQYQKEGPGSLKRMYLDRIHAPDNLVGLERSDLKDLKPLKCDQCDTMLGTPYCHKREGRLAYRVIPGRISKRRIT